MGNPKRKRGMKITAQAEIQSFANAVFESLASASGFPRSLRRAKVADSAIAEAGDLVCRW